MGFVMIECHYGLGRHKYFLNPNHYESFLKYNYLDWNQVFITLCACKLSICMFLLRISKFAKWRNFLYGVMTFLVLSHLPLELLFLLQCIPLNKNWNMDVPGRCFSKVAVEDIIIVQGGPYTWKGLQWAPSPVSPKSLPASKDSSFNLLILIFPPVCSILSDVVLAAFPILLLYNMRLPSRQKIQLSLLLGLGIITAFACIARTAFSYEIKQDDVTWQGVPNALCRMLEINLGIIAACMPMMRTLFIHVKKKYSKRRDSESLSSTRTPASQLQWYVPPTLTPWYLRVKRNLWNPPPAMEMARPPSIGASDSDHSIPKPDSNIEKFPRPPLPKRRSTPQRKVNVWPQHKSSPVPEKSHWSQDMRVKPENATWAEDESFEGEY